MSAPEISPPTTCTSCGVPLRAASASRVCPACVLRLAMADDGTAGAQIAADLPPEAEISSATVGSLGMVRYFGDYELLDEIARGGMGVVYRAMQLSLHRPVALKMILAGHLASEETMARFRLEASAAARLRHPNIVSVYEVGAHEGQQFFSMEFVGGSLAREMDRFCIPRVADGSAAALKLRHQKVAELMQKIAGALAVAHERGVLHRDVKPGNILLAENDEPKLGDFGLAKQLGHESSLTLSTAVLGSPSYMAPEQTRGGNSSLTTAVDIYGLGAVLYELLTGRPPFQGGNALDTMRQVQHDAPVAPSKLVSKVDLDLETICLKCLEKAPSDRYDSARAVAEELGRVLRKEPILARPVSRMVHLWRWSGRNPKLSAALVALLVALLVGVSGIVWQWRAAEQARSLQAQALMETKAANTAQALSLEHLRWGEVDRWLERREPAPALAQLARFLRERPEDWRAAMYAMSIVDQHSFCFKASPSVEAGVDSSSYAKLSPDAKWIVYSTNMHTIHVREAATGKEVKTITQPAEYPKLRMLKAALTGEKLDPLAHFRAHALNANNQLALCTQDGGITVRAIPEGEIIPLIRATPKDPLVDLAFTSNGEYLIGHTGEGSVEMWKVNALRQNPMVFNLSAGVTDAIPSADGSIILVWNPEEGVVAEGATGNEITRLKAVQKFVFGTISGDGTRVALVEMQSVTRVWDVPDRRELPAMPVMPSYWGRAMLSQDGSRIMMSGYGEPMVVRDVASTLPVSQPLWTHQMPLVSDTNRVQPFFVASPDHRVVASTSTDDTVHLWDLFSGQPLAVPLRLTSGGSGFGISLSADAATILIHNFTVRAAGAFSLWKQTNTKPPVFMDSGAVVESRALACLSPDGRLAAVGTALGWNEMRFVVSDVDKDKTLVDTKLELNPVSALFSPDHQRAYMIGNKWSELKNSKHSKPKIWVMAFSLSDGKALWQVDADCSGLFSAGVISPDGRSIVLSVGNYKDEENGTLLTLDAATGVLTQRKHEARWDVVRFAPDQSGRILIGGVAFIARIVNGDTNETLATLPPFTTSVLGGAWSPDGRKVAVHTYDHAAIYDAVSGKQIGSPLRLLSLLGNMEFSPDGTMLATGCRDGTLRLWDASTGEPLCPPRQQGSSCDTVHFSANGRSLFVRDPSGFRFWDVANAEPITIHYSAPYQGLLMSDCEYFHAMTSPDCSRVFCAQRSVEATLWEIQHPPSPVPSWFPDLLETLALMRMDAAGNSEILNGEEIFKLQATLKAAAPDDPYATWAKRALRM